VPSVQMYVPGATVQGFWVMAETVSKIIDFSTRARNTETLAMRYVLVLVGEDIAGPYR
jgi:hypothetical protein